MWLLGKQRRKILSYITKAATFALYMPQKKKNHNNNKFFYLSLLCPGPSETSLLTYQNFSSKCTSYLKLEEVTEI